MNGESKKLKKSNQLTFKIFTFKSRPPNPSSPGQSNDETGGLEDRRADRQFACGTSLASVSSLVVVGLRSAWVLLHLVAPRAQVEKQWMRFYSNSIPSSNFSSQPDYWRASESSADEQSFATGFPLPLSSSWLTDRWTRGIFFSYLYLSVGRRRRRRCCYLLRFDRVYWPHTNTTDNSPACLLSLSIRESRYTEQEQLVTPNWMTPNSCQLQVEGISRVWVYLCVVAAIAATNDNYYWLLLLLLLLLLLFLSEAAASL